MGRSVLRLAALCASLGLAACADDDPSAQGGGSASVSGSTTSGPSTSSSTGAGASGAGGEGGGSTSICGDGICAPDETCAACADDCGACCGDDACVASELCDTCADDCGACTASAPDVTRGPYLQNGSDTAVTVRWRTAEATDSVVAYGPGPDALWWVVRVDEPTTEHEVRLEGLLPDTRYVYGFGASDAPLRGRDEEHAFVTAPPPGTSRPTRVWVIGDSGTANDDARAVRDAYLAHTGSVRTDLWLMLGDNAYDDGTDAEYQAAVFDVYPSLLRSAVLWPTLGNHDGQTADSTTESGPYYDVFTLPRAAEAGGTASGTEAYYSFDFGDVHFVCLDSYDLDVDPSSPQGVWLENDLAANDSRWLVAFFHHPPYTKGSHDSDAGGAHEDMRVFALPVLESYGVDLVLAGHSHAYERSLFLNGHYGTSDTLEASMLIDDGDGRVDGDGAYARAGASLEGAVYVVAGSSGKLGGGPLDHPAMFLSLNELGSLVLDVDEANLHVEFVDDAGEVRDWFTLAKP